MRTLQKYIEESLLDDFDDLEKKMDKNVEDPFKFIAGLPKSHLSDLEKYKKDLETVKVILAKYGKEKSPEKAKSAKCKIGINYRDDVNKYRPTFPDICIKCDGENYTLTPNKEHLVGLELWHCKGITRSRIFNDCETVYVLKDDFMDKFREFKNKLIFSHGRVISHDSDDLDAWEKYKGA